MTLEEFKTNRYGLNDIIKLQGRLFYIIGVHFEIGIFYLQDKESPYIYEIPYRDCELVKEDLLMITALEELQEIKSDLNKIGMEMLRERMPIELDKAKELLKPFAKIEKQIDRIIKEMDL